MAAIHTTCSTWSLPTVSHFLTSSVERNFYTTSSCGLCGKASLEAVRTISRWRVDRDPLRLKAATISSLPEKLRAAQRVFDRTGGLHAAALFDANGDLWCVREDVGRHNAVDKVVGWALDQRRLPLSGTTLMVSGRASFELVQKAVMAGIPALAAVSAPSSLAVDLAREMGLTLDRLPARIFDERLFRGRADPVGRAASLLIRAVTRCRTWSAAGRDRPAASGPCGDS